MQNLHYYVLGTKNSPLLKTYFEKYYQKLSADIKKIGFSSEFLEKIFQEKNHRDFLLSPDISSLINHIFNTKDKKSFEKLKTQIHIFLEEGIESKNLIQNQGKNIGETNIKLTTIDDNPYNTFEAHPDHEKTGGVLGWGEKTENEWLQIYEKTFALLKQVDTGIYEELNQIIKKIVPLGTAKNIHNSASYKECIGHLYLGYTINADRPEINNLEAIIHESSHNKLNLLLHFDPITLNPYEEKYYSAIRPDARPISGVFLGYHAFAPTMYIIMKAYNDGLLGEDNFLLDKIVLYYIKTKFLQKVIKKYAKLTKLGEQVSAEIDYVIHLMDTILKEINPPSELIANCKKRQIKHFQEVNNNYPHLQY